MTNKEADEALPYYFWTYPWEITPTAVKELNPKFVLCKIDVGSIILYGEDSTLAVNMVDVEECKTDSFFTGSIAGKHIYFARLEFPEHITFQQRTVEINRLCIAAMDPIGGVPSDGETRSLIHVINELRTGKVPVTLRNPYHRALIHHQREDEFTEERWIATNPPPTYTEWPTLWHGLKPVLIIVAITITFILLGYILSFFGVLPPPS